VRQSSAETGTHFPVVLVEAHRDGDLTTPCARLQNLARARRGVLTTPYAPLQNLARACVVVS
jgi:hypothetical protein